MKMKDNEISLAKFLSRYLFITGEDLCHLTHEDVKQLFPQLRRVSLEHVRRHPILIISNKVLLVNDGRKTIPYRIPKVKEFDGVIRQFNLIKDEMVYHEGPYDIVSMSNYELKTLLNNKFNPRSDRMHALKELEERGIILKKKYNRKKDNRVEDYYGEY